VRVSVIIPTRSEAQAIGRVLADITPNLVHEVIVVNSSSSDGTPEIAARMGARNISETRRGYGQASLTGLAAASVPDIVVFLDGDYSDRRLRSLPCRSSPSSTAAPTSPSVLDSRVRARPVRCLGMPGLAIGSLRTTNSSLLIFSLEYTPARKKLSIVSQEARARAQAICNIASDVETLAGPQGWVLY